MDTNAFRSIQYGMFVVCSKSGEKMNGQIANTVFQVTSNPAMIAVCIAKTNLTHDYITASRVFSVSVIAQTATLPFIGRFGFKSGREIDKFKETRFKAGTTGVPIVTDYALSYFEVEMIQSMDIVTHTLFIGKVVEAEVMAQGEPMTYSYYHQIKGGKTPAAAPTFISADSVPQPHPEIAKEAVPMKKFTCTVCGYIYDPQQGDPDAGIKPGTPFESLPETWVCPVCGAPKSAFEENK